MILCNCNFIQKLEEKFKKKKITLNSFLNVFYVISSVRNLANGIPFSAYPAWGNEKSF